MNTTRSIQLVLLFSMAFMLTISISAIKAGDVYWYDGGNGSMESPFEIAEPNQLIVMSQHPEQWDKCFILTADINLALAEPNTFTTAVIAPDTVNSNHKFDGTPFTGVFDGSGHIISNLTINTHGTGNYYLGLIGKIDSSGAEVKNLGLENVIITGGYYSDYLGGLCGENYSGKISDCYATSLVTGSNLSSYLGGLCGHNSGKISNCYATSSVTGGENSSSIGGLCGLNFGSISNCYTTSSVTGGDRSRHLGGLCGRNSIGSILNCYATGSVNGAHQLGGLCGGNWNGNISNCYATGAVTGDRYLGGLCGENTGVIINCYSTGLVSHGWPTAGLCGYSRGSVTKCYFLDTAGLDNGLGTPLTDSQMKQQSSFIGWDFIWENTNGTEDVWWMHVDGLDYPRLRWQKHAPVADAGKDQQVYTGISQVVQVTLDGTGSYDPDDDPLSYRWSWTIDEALNIATGGDGIINMQDFSAMAASWLQRGYLSADVAPVQGDGTVDVLDLSALVQAWLSTPVSANWDSRCDIEPTGEKVTIELPVGENTIELVVNNGIKVSDPNEVVVTVIGPLEGDMLILPQVIRPQGFLRWIMATIILPEDISADEIADQEKLLLYPGAIEADSQWILPISGATTVIALFDKTLLLEAVEESGLVELQVEGKLENGQYFFGSDTVWVKPG